jgi:hypothetical protein
MDFWSPSGLIGNLYYVFVLAAFITPLVNLIAPPYLIQVFMRKFQLKQGDKSKITQKEAQK